MQLAGRIALVTGASRGIGRAIASALAARGAHLVLAARTVEPRVAGSGASIGGSLRETAELLTPHGVDVLPIGCDLDDPEQVRTLADAALAWQGRVDVLVNNAAFLGKASFHGLAELSLQNWQRQLNINLTAPMLLSQSLAPAMRAAEGGAIVNITSSAADMRAGDVPGFAYGTCKAALNRLTIALARELRSDGTTVFALDPGYVRTEIAEQAARLHTDWDTDIEAAHRPEVAAAAVADLLERPSDQVSGRIWEAVSDGPAVLRHNGFDDATPRRAGPSNG